MASWLTEALRSIEAAELSGRHLRAAMFAVFTVDKGSPVPALGGDGVDESVLVCMEKVLAAVSRWSGEKVSCPGQAARLLRRAGRPELASRVQKLSKVRNRVGHPEVELATDILELPKPPREVPLAGDTSDHSGPALSRAPSSAAAAPSEPEAEATAEKVLNVEEVTPKEASIGKEENTVTDAVDTREKVFKVKEESFVAKEVTLVGKPLRVEESFLAEVAGGARAAAVPAKDRTSTLPTTLSLEFTS